MMSTNPMMSAVDEVKRVASVAAVAAAAAAAEAEAEDESPLLKSVSSLRTISFAMTTFCRRFYELQEHLDSIQHSINQRSKHLHSNQGQQTPQPQQEEPMPNSTAVVDSSQPPTDQPRDTQRLGETISGRGLRRYIVSRLSDDDGDKLRDDVCQILKRTPDPAQLVLDCIGGFYLQGSKAYTTDSPMITARQASILVLEFFLVSGCSSKMAASVKEEAQKAAITWRSRLVREGGIANCGEPDALGLLLFLAAFGIPRAFGIAELYDIIRLSYIQRKADVLRHSSVFVERIKDIIQGMADNGMSVAAASLACAFGLEDKFSPVSLLSSFVQEVDSSEKELRRGQFSYVSLIEASKKQVADLKLVLKCVEDNKLNCREVAEWKIDETIYKLEKKIENFEKKKNEKNLKRKVEELGLAKQARTQERHHQLTTTNASYLRPPPAAVTSQEKLLYDRLLPQAMFGGGYQGLFNGFTDASIKSSVALSDGIGMGGLLNGTVHGAFQHPLSSHGVSAGAGPSIDTVRLSSGSVGVHGALGNGLPLVDSGRTSTSERIRLYGWHEDRAVNNDFVGESLLGVRSAAGQGFMGLSMPMVQETLVPSQRGPTSNLYQFADTVLQRESFYPPSDV